jgi:hypothetical protein
MKHSGSTIDICPVEKEVLSASEFLRLTKENPQTIKQTRVIMNRLGSKNFGSFEVTYTRPIYKHNP